MVKLWPPILASPTLLRQLHEVGMDPTMSVSYSPFGPPTGTMFTRAPPKVKGVKGIAAIRAVDPRIASGLERAISISKAHRETGTALVVIRGRLRRVPRKAAAMARAVAA